MENNMFNMNGSTDIVTSYALSTPIADSPGFIFEDPIQRLILSIIMCLVTIVGIPGNSMVILSVAFSKKLQTKTNAFVVNLALSDLFTCLVLPFDVVALLRDEWPLPNIICTIAAVVFWVGLGSSVVNLSLIAFNRFYLITRPRSRYDKLYSKRHIMVMLFIAWFVPLFLVSVPPLCGLGGIGYAERYKMCSADSTHPLSDVYSFLSSVLVELPCLIVIVTCYVKIYNYIRKKNRELFGREKEMQSVPEAGMNRRSSMHVAAFKRQVQVTKNMFIVVCSYILCIMPFAIACLIPPSYPAIPWVTILLVLNSCVNPIIYGLKHPQFQEMFKLMISCKLGRIPEPSKFLQAITSSTSSTYT